MQEVNNRFKFAIQLMNAQQWDRAEFELGHLLLAYPGNVNVLTALAELYYYKKNMRQVMAYLAKAQSGLNSESGMDEWMYVSKMLHFISDTEAALAVIRSYPHLENLPDLQRISLAAHYQKLDQAESALAIYRQIDQSLMSDNDHVLFSLTLLFTGDLEGSKAQLNEALRCNPENAYALQRIAMLDVAEGRATRMQSIEAACMSAPNLMDLSLLKFALFHEYDALGDTGMAFSALQEANQARASSNFHAAELETELANTYLQRLGSMAFDDVMQETLEESSSSPVFIVGLPRTGTTLLEKSLSSVVNMQAVGEHLGFRKAVEKQLGIVFGSPYETCHKRKRNLRGRKTNL